MRSLIAANYETYRDLRTSARENHLVRLVGSALVSIFFAVFFNIATNSGIIVTALAVLTGFIFAALCSDHSLVDARLPVPKDELQVAEIVRLGHLATNFQSRSAYFIFLAICTIGLLVLISTAALPEQDRLIPASTFAFLDSYSLNECLPTFFRTLRVFLASFAAFMSLECVYTFYRLSETTLAIVYARRIYLRSERL
ncbi:hypothetical protein J2S34_000841 [Nitrobacter winogradskyi]|uniref:Uncharacterized protein n=1 Tax=Nitrobacter winogradskyi TaxID=913 RepID=A0ACC6AFA6_NITWI|nr:hypothetical protein [Nitrobacter winogradskyi]MCP1998419.1 hypothetical protein [Nitrobacter winogradskyi]